MRFKYSKTSVGQDDYDVLPRLPITLFNTQHEVEVIGLVDNGATVNVLPYAVGLQLGAIWEPRKAMIRMQGVLKNQSAIPLIVWAQVGQYRPVRLAFAWVMDNALPVILGQTNFFLEFEVCFYRNELEFEVRPAVPGQ